jgi:hypothetical protein
MKIMKLNLLAITIMFAAMNNVYSQTLDEIIAKNIEVMGGKDKIKSITSIYLENTMEAMGNESASTTVVLVGKGAKIKTDINGQIMIQCYTDKGGWMINPFMGSSEATVMPNEQYKSGKGQINLEESFVDYAIKGNKVELLGKEKLENDEAFKIKVTTSDSISTIYYIDAKTYYVAQTTMTTDMMGQQVDITTKLSDYQKTDYGIVLANTTSVSYGEQFSMVIKLKKVEFNKPVDPTIFDIGNLKLISK